jgi:SAM-dependent methyltransferase
MRTMQPPKEHGFYSTLWTGALAVAANNAKAAAASLGQSQWASIVRAWCVPYLKYGMEDIFALPSDPKPGLIALIDDLTAYLSASAKTRLPHISAPAGERKQTAPVERVTGQHYGNLFREFNPASFAGEPVKLLGERLSRNNVATPNLNTARVLDAGCGGGRYSVAWHLLGAGHVLGVDLSDHGVADARARVAEMKIDNVEFQLADVVELPLQSDSFDIVFSNGVLHHTRDWRRGIENLVRVLKPGGLGWLYLIENPGGYFWDINELCRDITTNDSHEDARLAVASLGLPANRVFYMLDHAMAPINIRLTPEEITTALTEVGARSIRRLERGVDFDRVERVYQKDPYAVDKFGVGENRFVFSK